MSLTEAEGLAAAEGLSLVSWAIFCSLSAWCVHALFSLTLALTYVCSPEGKERAPGPQEIQVMAWVFSRVHAQFDLTHVILEEDGGSVMLLKEQGTARWKLCCTYKCHEVTPLVTIWKMNKKFGVTIRDQFRVGCRV